MNYYTNVRAHAIFEMAGTILPWIRSYDLYLFFGKTAVRALKARPEPAISPLVCKSGIAFPLGEHSFLSTTLTDEFLLHMFGHLIPSLVPLLFFDCLLMRKLLLFVHVLFTPALALFE